MKKLNVLMLTGALLFGGLASSCSFFGDDPYTIENVDYYTLSSMIQRDEELNAEAGTSTENVAETTKNEESTENNAE